MREGRAGADRGCARTGPGRPDRARADGPRRARPDAARAPRARPPARPAPGRARAVGGNPLHALELGRLVLSGASLAPGEAASGLRRRWAGWSPSGCAVWMGGRGGRCSRSRRCRGRRWSCSTPTGGEPRRRWRRGWSSVPVRPCASATRSTRRRSTPRRRRGAAGGARDLARPDHGPGRARPPPGAGGRGTDDRLAARLEEVAREVSERGAADTAAELARQARRLTSDGDGADGPGAASPPRTTCSPRATGRRRRRCSTS